jgi:hypothetical protein
MHDARLGLLPLGANGVKFCVGDKVRPRPEWREDPNRIPSGRIVRIEPWGDCGAIYVECARRAFAGYVFERDEE